MNLKVTAFYIFKSLDQSRIERLEAALTNLAADEGIRGLMLIGPEGVNGTVVGHDKAIELWKKAINEKLETALDFKDSWVSKFPFNEFKIKIKEEIVTLGRKDLVPPSQNFYHLSPREWHEALQDPNAVVIDTRNSYEVEIGKFRQAIHFKTEEFGEFPARVAASGIPKNKKVLMYCTGGIRCEKAILAMQEQGYNNVHQLQGGILNYLNEFPNQDFEGECFVFDYRVAVDQNLQPTQKYNLCPHCGQPAAQKIECAQCAIEAVICHHCVDKGGALLTCSKNCAHHFEIGSRSKRKINLRKASNSGKAAP